MSRAKPDDGLRAIIHAHLPLFHWQSVETGAISGGVPDSNYCCRGVEGWVESKSTDAWSVDLRPAQVGWIARRVRAGGRVHVAIRRRHDGGARRGPPADELWLWRAGDVVQLKVGGLRWAREQPTTCRWSGGPTRWNWSEVAAALLAR